MKASPLLYFAIIVSSLLGYWLGYQRQKTTQRCQLNSLNNEPDLPEAYGKTVGEFKTFSEVWSNFVREYDHLVNGSFRFKKVAANGDVFWLQRGYPPSDGAVSIARRMPSWSQVLKFASKMRDESVRELITVWKADIPLLGIARNDERDVIPFILLDIYGENIENTLEEVRRFSPETCQTRADTFTTLMTSEVFLDKMIVRQNKKSNAAVR